MIVVNILLVLNVSAYYSSVAEGAILILAVLGGSLSRHSPVADYLRLLVPQAAGAAGRHAAARGAPGAARPAGAGAPRGRGAAPSWLERHRAHAALRPAGLSSGSRPCVVATDLVYGNTLANLGYYNSLLVLSSFLAILALGQGAAILTGGLDLSLPWMIGLVGILTAGPDPRLGRGRRLGGPARPGAGHRARVR